jgi:hypothetical protein
VIVVIVVKAIGLAMHIRKVVVIVVIVVIIVIVIVVIIVVKFVIIVGLVGKVKAVNGDVEVEVITPHLRLHQMGYPRCFHQCSRYRYHFLHHNCWTLLMFAYKLWVPAKQPRDEGQ